MTDPLHQIPERPPVHRSRLRSRPVFIAGIARSGTTLVQSLLDGHPQLVVDAAESRFFLEFVPAARQVPPAERAALAERIFFRPEGRVFDPSGDHFAAFFQDLDLGGLETAFHAGVEPEAPLGSYLESAVLAFGTVSGQDGPGRRRWVEKSIFNERYVEQIFAWWPEARVIHMVRDPRAIVCSYRKRDRKQGRPPTPVAACLATWLQSARLGLARRETFGSQRYLLLPYETLVREPREVVLRTSRFLGIEPHPILLEPTKVGGRIPWRGNAVDSARFTGVETRRGERWREDLAGDVTAVVEEVAGPTMEAIGYRRSHPPTLATRATAFLYRSLIAGHRLRTRFRSVRPDLRGSTP